jgi:hypothetical protein
MIFFCFSEKEKLDCKGPFENISKNWQYLLSLLQLDLSYYLGIPVPNPAGVTYSLFLFLT